MCLLDFIRRRTFIRSLNRIYAEHFPILLLVWSASCSSTFLPCELCNRTSFIIMPQNSPNTPVPSTSVQAISVFPHHPQPSLTGGEYRASDSCRSAFCLIVICIYVFAHCAFVLPWFNSSLILLPLPSPRFFYYTFFSTLYDPYFARKKCNASFQSCDS